MPKRSVASLHHGRPHSVSANTYWRKTRTPLAVVTNWRKPFAVMATGLGTVAVREVSPACAPELDAMTGIISVLF